MIAVSVNVNEVYTVLSSREALTDQPGVKLYNTNHMSTQTSINNHQAALHFKKG